MEEVNSMLPYEKDIFVSMITEQIKKEEEEIKNANNNRQR